MIRVVRLVNTIADFVLRPELTLSAAPWVDQPPDGSGLALESAPAEAAVRDERDPYIDSESELRARWGDR